MKKNFLINKKASAKDAMARFNEIAEPASVLVVAGDDSKVIGTLSDGDIRRGLLKDLSLSESVTFFMNEKFLFQFSHESIDEKMSFFKKKKIRFVPELDKEMRFVRMLDLREVTLTLPVDAVIMAGGRGERLRPLTDKTPKPLLKIGDKPIIQYNIDLLASYGVKNIIITLGYLGDQIKEYLGDGSAKNLVIDYVVEKEPLGTAGAAKLVREFKNEVVLLMNSDLLTNINLADFYNAFRNSLADLAVATVPYSVSVPYAVMEIDDKNGVNAFKEKPVYTYYSNAGIYLIKREMLSLIPEGQKFDATDLMETLMKNNFKIVSFPILTYWLDIGKFEDYNKAQEDIKKIIF